MKKNFKKDIQIVLENKDEIWALCCFHNETKPSLLISKTGEFAGYYKCFGCGKFGRASELNIRRDWKKETKSKPNINWKDVNIACINKLKNSDLIYLANKFNVNPLVLIKLNLGWNGSAYTYPMYNKKDRIIGIQRRFETKELEGLKLSMAYSDLGLFVPSEIIWKKENIIFITEGFSDLAALLDLGFMGIGRPNALACIDMTVEWLAGHSTPNTQYVIITDADEAGVAGARELMSKWEYGNMKWILPQRGNDIRKWIKLEGKEKVTKFLKNV